MQIHGETYDVCFFGILGHCPAHTGTETLENSRMILYRSYLWLDVDKIGMMIDEFENYKIY